MITIPTKGYGIKKFKKNGYSSLVEQLAMKRVDMGIFRKQVMANVRKLGNNRV